MYLLTGYGLVLKLAIVGLLSQIKQPRLSIPMLFRFNRPRLFFSYNLNMCKVFFLSLFIYFRSYDLSFIHPWRFNWRKLCMSYEMNSLFADDILRYMVMEILSGFNSFWIFFYLMYLIYYPPPSNTMNNKDFFFKFLWCISGVHC